MLRIILSVLFLATTGFAQNPSRLNKAVQSYVSENQFMGSVLVARGDQILLSKGYGYANLELDILNTPATKFRIGSLTKQFTAAAILLLEEQGKLYIKDPIKKYLPDAPAAWGEITIFHVLTHTSGIPTNMSEFLNLPPVLHTPKQLVGLFRDKPLDFEPGEEWKYSNSGYILLGYLIEKVSGETYQEFIQENIFTPLEMNDSGYDSSTEIIPRRASGYSPGPNGPENAAFFHMSIPYSAGALYSTTEDLLRWIRGLFSGKLLSAASLKKMTTPYRNAYGLGIGVQPLKGRNQIGHAGGVHGFRTYLTYFPDSEVTIVVLANLIDGSPSDLANLLTELAHGEKVILPAELKTIILSAGVLIAIFAPVIILRPQQKATVGFDSANGDRSETQSVQRGEVKTGASSINAVEIRNLHFSYTSVEVLHGISFSVRRGEIVGLLGPNGAGKSTIIKIIAGIHPPDRGKVHITGYSLPEQHLEAKKIIGYLPESPLMYECLSGMEFLEFMGRLYGMNEKVLHVRIRAFLEAFELNNIRVPRISQYSKGMRQKILLSAALLHDPEVLLLDEPLVGLDIDTSILIKDLLMTLTAQGKTIVYSSHILDVVEKVCHRVILIDQGRILADAPLEELKSQTGKESLEIIFRKLTHSEDTGPKIARIMETLQS